MKFEHSLPKMMTRPERWSTNLASGSLEGASLVVQVSGGTLTRKSSVTPPNQHQIRIRGKTGSTQFLEQGKRPALFFVINHHDC
jgi:hypothetical protein